MTQRSASRTFGSGETTQIRQICPDPDILLVFDDHEPTLKQARMLSENLSCELIEVSDSERLADVLGLRPVTLVLLAIDLRGAASVAALRILSQAQVRAPLVLLGETSSRMLGSARQLARERGLNVAGELPRTFDPNVAERLCISLLGTPPPVPCVELERALLEHELTLLYQPKMRIEPDRLRIQGVEAFVRWQHPRRGLLRPGQFLPSLERENMLVPLMDYVMREAIRQAGQWHENGLSLQVGINLSPRLVRDHEFPHRVGVLLGEHNVPPERISIDITEETEKDRALALDVFTALRLMGIDLTLDNFGKGYSSLTELYRMPVSELKIDGSLIAEVPQIREPSTMVRAIIEFAHILGLRVCAGGVERAETVDYLREVHCDCLQGRVVSGPVAPHVISEIAPSLGCRAVR